MKQGDTIEIIKAFSRNGGNAFKGYTGTIQKADDSGLIIRGESSYLVVPAIGPRKIVAKINGEVKKIHIGPRFSFWDFIVKTLSGQPL